MCMYALKIIPSIKWLLVLIILLLEDKFNWQEEQRYLCYKSFGIWLEGSVGINVGLGNFKGKKV